MSQWTWISGERCKKVRLLEAEQSLQQSRQTKLDEAPKRYRDRNHQRSRSLCMHIPTKIFLHS
jgi:hypothetical protein